MINFLHLKYFLLLFPIIFLLLLLYFNWWKKIHFSWMNDIKNIFKSNTVFYKLYYVFIFIIFLLFVSIFAKPVQQNTLEKITKNWIDIQIVLDVSYSMLAKDLEPNRLEVAKDVIFNFIDKITTDRVWLIVYSWKTFTSLPLSFDYNIIKKTIKKIDINIINQQYSTLQWTATWDAIILAWKSFNNNKREKVIILLTDWEANKGIDPLLASEYVRDKFWWNIKIYTIWIGWNEKTTVSIINNLWIQEEIKIWWLNEEILKLISEKTNWLYFRATNRGALEDIFNKISKIEKKEITSDIFKINKENYTFVLYLLIFLFFIFLILKKWKRI